MMNEEVINAGIKGYESYIRVSYGMPSYRIPEYTQKAIKQSVIWAVTQYIMNTTDQFKEFVVSQTQGPKNEVSGKQSSQYVKSQYAKDIAFPNPVAFHKGRWYYSYDALVDVDYGDLIRPVISEEHGKQLYRSV